MGFISEQAKKTLKKEKPKPMQESELKVSVAKISGEFYNLMKTQLKKYDEVDVKHLKTAFEKAIVGLEEEMKEYYAKLEAEN